MSETLSTNPEVLESRPSLQEKMAEAEQETKTNLRSLLDSEITERADHERRATSKIIDLMDDRIHNIRVKIEEEYTEFKSQNPTREALEDKEDQLFERYQTLIDGLMQRMELLIESNVPGSKTFDEVGRISTSQEVIKLYTDIKNYLDKDFEESYLKEQGETALSLTDPKTIEKITKGEELDPKERAALALQLKDILLHSQEGTTTLMDSGAMVLVAKLSSAEKLRLVTDPNLATLERSRYVHLIYNLTIGNVLSVGQGEFALNGLGYTTEAQGLQHESVTKTREQMDDLQEAAATAYQESFGHRNPAKEMLSFKGVGSAILFANGFIGFTGNLLANIGSPIQGLSLNPAFWGSIGAMTAASEITDNFADAGPGKLSDLLKRFTRNPDEELADLNQEKINRQNKLTEDHYAIAKFYAQNAQAIFDIYYKKMGPNHGVLQLIEADFSSLPGFQNLMAAHPESADILGKLSQGFFKETELNLLDPVMQRDFINLSFKEQGLPQVV